ncbi:mono-functional DNA-alkylating methyl methanesulfonate N-term-domain-containing protein [Lobosporangium transversale]|uniref:Mono-functional DNA-alkylating methyl methanesulfonate N-term-domain-containing protein n=1 Tax=Lobosporangium transversale TaxID=64571 RepID=A0A1Y2GNP0_9FUNG|nr:mono-functional DNA-alkylating methyl methanesulfonate N-term-domain-containing protein [Lobosporangium transversale]ORZ14406.1 mono-functional DNA-alkylating methyl methanesulfonate N-term-domain-containing protein [Lobosporangium transversale]|eukprot:XP_021880884.1 mono-functional DNA-alkylating methyl methanesulfonate N-term-domain-containing protein [Lobosporangium transversale]
MAISALYGSIKIVRMRSTRRSSFNPVERISEFALKGAIIAMDFLTTADHEKYSIVILAVLFYSKETLSHHIATFSINLDLDDVESGSGALPMQLGNSQLTSNSPTSVFILKALPNIPRAMVYIDEEKITLVTVESPLRFSKHIQATHIHHPPLQLPRKDSSLEYIGLAIGSASDSVFPLISSCAIPPPSPYPESDQTLYLGSDTSDLFRVRIMHKTNTLHYELISSDRPVGRTMIVLARREFISESSLSETSGELLLNIDYLLYSNDYGDGGLIAFKEEEDGVDIYALTNLQNSSPVVDFCVREPLLPGRDSLFLCSGMKSEGSLREVRSGISVVSSGSSGSKLFAGATGLWSIKKRHEDAFESVLVVSFIQSTKLMHVLDGDSLEEIADGWGLSLDQATVHAGRLADNHLFQVNRLGVVIASLDTG